MNKELIKKYKVEFDYWCEGDTLLVSDKYEKRWITLTENIWLNGSSENLLIIRDDEYVEFRKALAEGKTIQYYECVEQHETYEILDKYDWLDWKSANPSVSFSKNLMYRIKPEEQHIKIGDYIYDIKRNKYYRIENVLDEKVETELFRIYKSSINDSDYRLWKPKPGELVVMYSEDYTTGFTVTLWEENSKFIPVPFAGELPE